MCVCLCVGQYQVLCVSDPGRRSLREIAQSPAREVTVDSINDLVLAKTIYIYIVPDNQPLFGVHLQLYIQTFIYDL